MPLTPYSQPSSGGMYTIPLGISWIASGGPNDSTTYFAPMAGLIANVATAVGPQFDTWAEANFEIPTAGTIISVSYTWKNYSGVLATGENVLSAIRVNDAADIADTTEPRWDQSFETLVVSGLSTVVAAGDRIAGKILTPAWVTNPVGVAFGALVTIQT